MKVFIENETGSNQKNLYNEKTLEYEKTVIVSREYPYPYGFILNTMGEDGDNTDCFIITEKPLKSGETDECEPIGLMQQIETSWNPDKKGVDEEDHNIIAVLNGEHVEIDNIIKKRLSDFVSHVFDHIEGKKVRVGEFLSKEDALKEINQKLNPALLFL